MGSIPTEVKRIFYLPRVVPWFPLQGLTPSGSFMGFTKNINLHFRVKSLLTICVHSATLHNILGNNYRVCGFITHSLVLSSIVWDWILIYRNWSIKYTVGRTISRCFRSHSLLFCQFLTNWSSFLDLCHCIKKGKYSKKNARNLGNFLSNTDWANKFLATRFNQSGWLAVSSTNEIRNDSYLCALQC